MKVKLLEANAETGQMSLTMRDSGDLGRKSQQQAGSASNGDVKQKTPRKYCSNRSKES